MAKERFLVVFDAEDDRIAGLIEKHYPKAYPVADNVLVLAEDTSVGVISKTLKMYPVAEGEDHSHGIVFALSGPAQGYARRDLWDWLRAVSD